MQTEQNNKANPETRFFRGGEDVNILLHSGVFSGAPITRLCLQTLTGLCNSLGS
jgi:hypothetical protein